MNEFNLHMEQHHREDIQFECKVCTDMFHNECELQKHIEGKHSESRQESNTDCDDKSRRSEDTKTMKAMM